MHRIFRIGIVLILGAVCASVMAPGPQCALAQKAEPGGEQKRKDYELRTIRVGKTFQGVRFKISTGESWIIDGDEYTKIPEAAIPAGEYDVTLITDDSNWMAFRIDRLTGTTWLLRNNKWVKVKEPAEKPPDKAKQP